jgi:hypothetical protein
LLTNPLPFALSEVEGVNGARPITHKNQQNQPSTAVLPFDGLRANGNKLSRFYPVLDFVSSLGRMLSAPAKPSPAKNFVRI